MPTATTTRFGALWLPLSQASSVLRARAAALSVPLRDATRVDLVAAVIGADGWLLATGASDLASAGQYGRPAVSCLAAVLRRAAGHGDSPDALAPEASALPPELCRESERYADYARETLGNMAPAALRAAAHDLSGAPGRLETLAALLDAAADIHGDPQEL